MHYLIGISATLYYVKMYDLLEEIISIVPDSHQQGRLYYFFLCEYHQDSQNDSNCN